MWSFCYNPSMAGGFGVKMDPKNHKIAKNGFNSEIFKDSPPDFSDSKPQEKPIITLSGILGLGQTVEVNRQTDNLSKQGEKILWGGSHLEQELNQLQKQSEAELQKSITELRQEIAKLIKATDELEKDVAKVAIDPIVEASEYQIKFFERIKNFIANFRKNISEASCWLESFSSKKKKKNYFWNTAKNRKTGGEQYLFSNEHSAARSIN